MKPYAIADSEASILRSIREAGRRRLPARYATDLWDRRFQSQLESLLKPGMSILDIGAGRRPTVRPEGRPSGTRYVGLDIDANELSLAAGGYDETFATPAEQRVAGLEGRFDLVLSFFVFEHVRSTEEVIENIRFYLKPGGVFLAQLAGARSPFSIANRFIPEPLAHRLLARSHEREADTVFPARYDRCTQSQLQALLAEWSEREVHPLYTGAGYVLFSRVLTAAYIAYEEWAYRGGHADLAPYYLIRATR
jgi:cyclopropane fatty-acyl-phospholipid synthase-like methyltransferase